MSIDPDKLSFGFLSAKDNFSVLDFTEDDGSDPLGIDEFIKFKAQEYIHNNLATVYSVRYDGELVAYFTLSMFAISVKQLLDTEQVGGLPIISYPAIQLGRMGVDKKRRGRGIGYWICEFCIGLSQEIGKRAACRYIVLQTSRDKTTYYENKCKFKLTRKQGPEEKVWMYRRVS